MGIRNGVCLKQLILLSISFLTTTTARKLTDEELHSLPKLFHLDDYERCLAIKDGLYCLGTFELTASGPNPTLDLIKEYMAEPLKYNRTLLRRGYCVSQRCPLYSNATLGYPALRNPALRDPTLGDLALRDSAIHFERCAAKYARRYSLTPRLIKLHYCTTHQQHRTAKPVPDGGQMFLYAVGAILMLNVIGTVYDCYKGDVCNKNAYIMAWSIPPNFARLTKVYDSGIFATFAPFQFFRMLMQWVVVFTHSYVAHFSIYLQNPESVEVLLSKPLGAILRNGAVLVQSFILISCFLTGYNLLLASKTTGISAIMLFKWILKRLAKILPVYLLVLGYVMTWWPQAGDGPMWAPLVGRESGACKKKFWSQVLFINNLVEPPDLCLLTTWALAVDMQLYIVSTILTLLLIRLRVRAVPILAFLFVASVALNVVLAYINEWEPMVKIANPETLRNLFRYTPSFRKVHISTWGGIPACFLGLFTAHYYFDMTNKKVKTDRQGKNSESNGRSKNGLDENVLGKRLDENNRPIALDNRKGLIRHRLGESNGQIQNGLGEDGPTRNGVTENDGQFENRTETQIDKATSEYGLVTKIKNQLIHYSHIYVIPCLLWWSFGAAGVDRVESRALTALYVGAERAVFTLLSLLFLIHVLTVDSFFRRLGAWRGWQAIGRLAFSLTVIHWAVNVTIVGSRREVVGTSLLHLSVDFLGTLFYSYLLAFPVCLLVELPAQKFLDLLIAVPNSVIRF